MILRKKEKNLLSRLPFTPKVDSENLSVKFSKGFIFDCYNNQEREIKKHFSNGAVYTEPTNINKSFSYNYGDKFYLNIPEDKKKTSIIKESEPALEDPVHKILIWIAPTSEVVDGERFLSENVFLQDQEAGERHSFSIDKVGENESDELYRLNSGFLIIPELSIVKFLEGFDFSIKRGDLIKKFCIKTLIKGEKSEPDPAGGGDLPFISNYSFTGVSIEEYEEGLPETKPVQMGREERLDGIYYSDLLNQKENLILNLNIQTSIRKQIVPEILTEVRGAKLKKNGVSTNRVESSLLNFLSEEEKGYYKSIVVIERFFRFKINEDNTVEEISPYEITRRYVVSDKTPAIESEPVIEVTVEKDDLPDDEFFISPKFEDEIEFVGDEISDSALAFVKAKVLNQPFTNINFWDGDATVVLQGAGFSGSDPKLAQSVNYGERRFKPAGGLSGFDETFPESKIDYSRLSEIGFKTFIEIIRDSTEIESESLETIKYDIQKGIFLSDSFKEIPVREDSYARESLMDECKVMEEYGEYNYKDVTKDVTDFYQRLT